MAALRPLPKGDALHASHLCPTHTSDPHLCPTLSGFPPGPPGDQAVTLLLDPLQFLERTTRQYGGTVGLLMGTERVVLVTDKQLARQVRGRKGTTGPGGQFGRQNGCESVLHFSYLCLRLERGVRCWLQTSSWRIRCQDETGGGGGRGEEKEGIVTMGLLMGAERVVLVTDKQLARQVRGRNGGWGRRRAGRRGGDHDRGPADGHRARGAGYRQAAGASGARMEREEGGTEERRRRGL